MTPLLPFVVVVFLLGGQANAFASAAVQAQRQKATVQQLRQQQQLLQQQQQAIRAPSRDLGRVDQPTTPETFPAKQRKIDRVEASRSKPSGPTSNVEEDDIFDRLGDDSEIWMKIVKPMDKLYIVQHYIERYRKDRVYIRHKPQLYVMAIDDLLRRNPQYIRKPFEQVLMIMAIMEYDFDNGDDKDQMALTTLGQNAYLANKKRLGIK